MLVRLRSPLVRVAASGAALAAAAAAARSRAESEGAAPAAESKSQPCLQLTLLPESTADVLKSYPAEYARVVADRVLVRPCMTEELETCPLRPFAVLQDGSSQSILLTPTAQLWHGPADISSSGRVGYPVLPISIAEEEPPPPPPSESGSPPTGATADAAADSKAPAPPPPSPSPPSPTGGEAEAEAAAQVPTLWEQIEEPWRLLEAAGVLTIDRDADSMPTHVALRDGAAAWQGELPDRDGGTRTVTVRLIDEAGAARLNLRGRTLAPECGFCRFMKDGPCGDQFVAWEACVDAAKESGEDFVDACGKPTLALKACTDAHPEYYGALSDDGEGEGDDAKASTGPDKK